MLNSGKHHHIPTFVRHSMVQSEEAFGSTRISGIINSKLWLGLELAALYIGLPLLVFLDLIPFSYVILLFLVTAGCMIYLLKKPSFNRRKLWNVRGFKKILKPIMIRFGTGVIVLSLIFLLMEPQYAFDLVKSDPLLWLLILILYPLLSVYPQEIIYRAFFFERYRRLFGNTNLLIHMSALAFGFLHIIYENYPAVFITYAAGYFLGRTYMRSRSLLAVSVEHALYGLFIFTIGMGKYFYNGM